MEYGSYAVLVAALTLTHLVQGITGFGGVVLALPILSFFFPLPVLVPALVAANLIQTAWFAFTERRHIDRARARSITLLSLAGLPAGYAVYHYLPADQLKLALGVIVLAVAARDLVLTNSAGTRVPAPMPWYHLLNFIGGLVQGALACGGPFLVISADRLIPDKTAFRATMMFVWTVLNVVLCLGYTVNQSWRMEMAPMIALAIPTIVVGTVLGQKLHHLIPPKPFRLIIHLVLLFSGAVLLRPVLGLVWPGN